MSLSLLRLLTAAYGTNLPKPNLAYCPQLAKADAASPVHLLVNQAKPA
jgi:hypothetical protein